jgi:3-hydroxyacyl-CoA dehydrogenase/enoyl-CoA hydratase/3-hydroxybutyryl-CoA epimerase
MNHIQVTRDDHGIVTLTWDMPDRSQNVFNEGSLSEFQAALLAAATDESVSGIIVASAKKAFIAGADLDTVHELAFGNQTAEEMNESVGVLSTVLREMETCGKPVVAALEGTALGGGFELALACHHRIVADDSSTKLGLPEATLGLLPGAGGTQRVPRMIGVQPSLPLLLEGKQLRPDKALSLGLVDAVVPVGEVLDAARDWILENPAAHTQPWDKKGFVVPGGGLEAPMTLQVLMVSNAMLAAKTHGNYPAGKAILSCIYEGLRTSLDAGLLVEKRYFLKLLLDPTAGAMIRTLFMSIGDANKLIRRPEGVEKREFKKIGVVGSGLMGAGIALVGAKKGIRMVVLDLTLEKAEGARTYAAGRLDRAIARGRSTEEKKADILSRIDVTDSYSDLEGADLIVEAVFEDRDIKANVTKQADAVLDDRAVLASNTSTLPITGLAEASPRPENFIGLHFFSPVDRMALVEVIKAEQTSERTLAWALDAVQALGKTPIVVNDSRGFYTSRVFGTYITEGAIMLLDGVKPALIENAGAMSGMPMPPLALADEVGLGLMYQVGVQTRKDLGDAAPENPSQGVLEVLVADHDRTGKRCGKGFYDHEDKSKSLWGDLGGHFPVADNQPDAAALIERFLFVQAIETARCMDEGVVENPEDCDVGAILGWGYAPYTGGPMSYIDRIGVAAFVARADELAAIHGPRFEPPQLLRDMAAEGRSFY